jgi:hypothetical protein
VTVETADGETAVTVSSANPALTVEHRAARKRLKIGDALGLYNRDRKAGVADVRAAPVTAIPVDNPAAGGGR